MARFFRWMNVKSAQRALWDANKAINNFRQMCRDRQNDEETFFTFVTLVVAHMDAERGTEEMEAKANKALLDFVNSFGPYAKRLAKHYATQQQAIAYIKDHGQTPDLGTGE